MTVRADKLLSIWELRLNIHADGRLKWADQTRSAIEGLVSRLRLLSADEEIEIDGDEHSDPMAKFIRVSTGEVLAELYQAPPRA